MTPYISKCETRLAHLGLAESVRLGLHTYGGPVRYNNASLFTSAHVHRVAGQNFCPVQLPTRGSGRNSARLCAGHSPMVANICIGCMCLGEGVGYFAYSLQPD